MTLLESPVSTFQDFDFYHVLRSIRFRPPRRCARLQLIVFLRCNIWIAVAYDRILVFFRIISNCPVVNPNFGFITVIFSSIQKSNLRVLSNSYEYCFQEILFFAVDHEQLFRAPFSGSNRSNHHFRYFLCLERFPTVSPGCFTVFRV